MKKTNKEDALRYLDHVDEIIDMLDMLAQRIRDYPEIITMNKRREGYKFRRYCYQDYPESPYYEYLISPNKAVWEMCSDTKSFFHASIKMLEEAKQ